MATGAGFPSFAVFFEAVTGHAPYLWQVQASEAISDGAPPEQVSVPTGFGKTSLMVCWVWALAADLRRVAAGGGVRRVPLRYVVVVDRRVVVDDTAVLARRLADCLSDPGAGGAVVAVAEVLRGGEELALEVRELRGGMPERPENVRHPAAPAVIIGTVDLVGSRLLWRGYGVNPQRRPIEAALVGCDVLLVLDEAHIAGQFLATLRVLDAQQVRDESLFGATVPGRFVVEMTATPRAGGGVVFDWAAESRERADVGVRRARRRSTRVEVVGVDAASGDAGLAGVVKGRGVVPGRRLLVFANTPKTVKAAAASVRASAAVKAGPGAQVLIGGMPEVFRQSQVLAGVVDAYRPGAEPVSEKAALVICATQTLEVGANLDADDLVTPVASASALVQRIGRVNRVGERDGCTVVIVVSTRAGVEEPVYGAAAGRLGRALLAQQPATLGELEDVLTGPWADQWQGVEHEDAVLPRHVFEAYTRTGGSAYEPEVGRWLRSPQDPGVEAQVAFRRSVDDVADTAALAGHLHRWLPGSGEMWTVPITTAREMVRAQVKGGSRVVLLDPSGGRRPTLMAATGEIPAGWILVMGETPDAFGIPGAGSDLTALVGPGLRRFAVIHAPDPEAGDGDGPSSELVVAARVGDLDAAVECVALAGDIVDLAPAFTVTTLLDAAGESTGWVEIGRVRPVGEPVPERVVTLEEHQDAVAARAHAWARRIGLPASVVHDIALAAAHHDDGKAADVVQRELRMWLTERGDLVMATTEAGALVAKSMLPRRYWARARALTSTPLGYRHEAGSAERYDHALEQASLTPVDADLVRHLILSHHGWFRGAGPTLTETPVPVPTYQDPNQPEWATTPDHFAALVAKYGAYTLAAAETVLRLADWHESRVAASPCLHESQGRS